MIFLRAEERFLTRFLIPPETFPLSGPGRWRREKLEGRSAFREGVGVPESEPYHVHISHVGIEIGTMFKVTSNRLLEGSPCRANETNSSITLSD